MAITGSHQSVRFTLRNKCTAQPQAVKPAVFKIQRCAGYRIFFLPRTLTVAGHDAHGTKQKALCIPERQHRHFSLAYIPAGPVRTIFCLFKQEARAPSAKRALHAPLPCYVQRPLHASTRKMKTGRAVCPREERQTLKTRKCSNHFRCNFACLEAKRLPPRATIAIAAAARVAFRRRVPETALDLPHYLQAVLLNTKHAFKNHRVIRRIPNGDGKPWDRFTIIPQHSPARSSTCNHQQMALGLHYLVSRLVILLNQEV